MSGKKLRVGAIILFVGLFALLLAQEANANDWTIGLGYGIAYTEGGVKQSLGYSTGKWQIVYDRHGQDVGNANSWSVFRQVKARHGRKVQPFMNLGATYWNDLLVDPDKAPRVLVNEHLTFKLGIGVKLWNILDIGIDHDSTAGRSEPNRGIDYAYLRFYL